MIILDIILWLVIAFVTSSVNILLGPNKAIQILIASIVIACMIQLPRWIDESGRV